MTDSWSNVSFKERVQDLTRLATDCDCAYWTAIVSFSWLNPFAEGNDNKNKEVDPVVEVNPVFWRTFQRSQVFFHSCIFLLCLLVSIQFLVPVRCLEGLELYVPFLYQISPGVCYPSSLFLLPSLFIYLLAAIFFIFFCFPPLHSHIPIASMRIVKHKGNRVGDLGMGLCWMGSAKDFHTRWGEAKGLWILILEQLGWGVGRTVTK